MFSDRVCCRYTNRVSYTETYNLTVFTDGSVIQRQSLLYFPLNVNKLNLVRPPSDPDSYVTIKGPSTPWTGLRVGGSPDLPLTSVEGGRGPRIHPRTVLEGREVPRRGRRRRHWD